MNSKSMHVCAAVVAFAILSVTAAPVSAQEPPPVAFEQVRDAGGRFFSAADTHSTAPNTLIVGIRPDAFRACAPTTPPFSPSPCTITRVAMDTLSFVVRPPDGYYVSSIQIDEEGTGAISRLADARGSSGWVIAGLPIDLDAPFGGAAQFSAGGSPWSRSRTHELSDSGARAVPVSLTTGLFAYAGAAAGAAHVELKTATVAVAIAPIGTAPKKTAIFAIQGSTGTFGGTIQGPTGTVTGPDGEDLSYLLQFDPLDTFTDAPGGTVDWIFPSDGIYNGASGTTTIIINPAESLLTWPSPAAISAGTALSDAQLNATAQVAGTTTTVAGAFFYTPPAGTMLGAGTHLLNVAFTPTDAVNYLGAMATVSITVNPLRIENPGSQTTGVGDDVRLRLEVSSSDPRRRGDNDHRGSDNDDRGRGNDRLKGKFEATGLPAGLRIEEDGEIRGKPTTAGTYRVVVTFTQKKVGDTVRTAFDWTVLPRPPKTKKR